jgi:GNAT superfamily N-acetyltransferase
MHEPLNIRPMSRTEVDTLIEWAAAEGWNPGQQDANCFWATDPDGFIAAEQGGSLIGGGAITAYGDTFGFIGLFIVRPEFRGRGIGNQLWHALTQSLPERLRPGATIGLDGVFAMQDYYAKGGFVFSHRNIRFRGEVPTSVAGDATRTGSKGAESRWSDGEIRPLPDLPFETLTTYDRRCFPATRDRFLRCWIDQPNALALGAVQDGQLQGYGVIRRCGDGCKVGPLFANDAIIASTLFDRLAAFAGGGAIFIDAPENNAPALALVKQRAMVEVFGCARMYLGPVPDIEHQRVFGVTSFELG